MVNSENDTLHTGYKLKINSIKLIPALNIDFIDEMMIMIKGCPEFNERKWFWCHRLQVDNQKRNSW